MFEILQTSLVKAFQKKFQAAAAALNLVHARQVGLETRMGAVYNDLSHSVMSVREDFRKYLKEQDSQNELWSDPDAMQIDSIEAVPNYL